MHRVVKLAALLFAVVLFIALAAFAYFLYSPLPPLPKLTGQGQSRTIRVGERERRVLEYVPAKLPPGSPLMIVLHGSFMTGGMMRRMTGFEFDALADKNNFAVFYPDAYKTNWNDCRIAGRFAARLENIDDLGFMRALIAEAKAKYSIDPEKVFVVGFSNGGHMAMTLATQSPSPVAGIAIFGSSMSTADNSRCPQDTPTPPVMIVDGTDDPLSPFNGGEVTVFGLEKKGRVISAAATAEEFARRNDILTPPTEELLPHRDANDPTSVQRFRWLRAGKPYVDFYAVHGGGHAVPQPYFRFPRLLGRTTADIDGPAEAIWFFISSAVPQRPEIVQPTDARSHMQPNRPLQDEP
ncbi:alpha/beta hydrolase family esterase [Edaphobacter modestus]|uniref:Polyhydroxybutyrate depolymerase n=1 Tax=Edaphobacter modestus TaxID=388466 RepID=A0A4Q7YTW1_9BACT|nr:PHB depolymerase family esterase [Edaphobacter modestus]RZU40355.1 polyhydroxybutyrate depolymerase [Edaphobacter modestus]